MRTRQPSLFLSNLVIDSLAARVHANHYGQVQNRLKVSRLA